MGDAEDDEGNANENHDESDDTVSCFVVRYTKKLAGYFRIGITYHQMPSFTAAET